MTAHRTLGPIAVALIFAVTLFAEDLPAPVDYPNKRKATGSVTFDGGIYEFDRGLTWRGMTVYLTLSGDLLAVDNATAQVKWMVELEVRSGHLFPVMEPMASGTRAAVGVVTGDLFLDGWTWDLETGQLLTPKTLSLPGARIAARPLNVGYGRCSKPFTVLLRTPAAFSAVCARLSGMGDDEMEMHGDDGEARLDGFEQPPEPAKPEIDFNHEDALCVCLGERFNSIGLSAKVYQSANQRTVCLSEGGFQTSGSALRSYPYLLLALPRLEVGTYGVAYSARQNRGVTLPTRWQVFDLIKVPQEVDPVTLIPPGPSTLSTPALPEGFQRSVAEYVHGIGRPGGEWPGRWRGDAPWFGNWPEKVRCSYYLGPDGAAVPHGHYVMIRENERWEGDFVDGVREGRWEHAAEDGVVETATFLHGRNNGPAGGERKQGGWQVSWTGQYADGKRDGLWRWIDNDRVSREESFANGVWNGRSTRWHNNGSKSEEWTCTSGRLDGSYQRWYPDGKVAVTGAFEAMSPPRHPGFYAFSASVDRLWTVGKRVGEWIRYAPDGRVLWRGTFAHGTGHLVDFRQDRSRYFEADLVDGLPTKVEMYDANERIEEQIDVLRDGEERHRLFAEDGGLEADGIWHEGRPWSGQCRRSEDIEPFEEGERLAGPGRRSSRR
jgi:antitoxin component YwqK of YwqJK toxin-antitoxin module